MNILGYQSRQDRNNAMVSQCSEDLRRVCGMSSYRRSGDEGIEIRGMAFEQVPVALDILGMPAATAVVTLLPNARGWLSRVVHYCVASVEVARWHGEHNALTVLACPVRRPAAYPYAAPALGATEPAFAMAAAFDLD